MKNLLVNVKEGFKKGIILWIIAHLLLYVVCATQKNFTVYDAQINKLHSPINFIAQLAYAGFLYTSLVGVFTVFVDNMFKYMVKGDEKKTLKSAILAIVITLLICVTMFLIKRADIVNKVIIKLMVVLMFIKAIVLVIEQVINNTIYNQKLQEKNQE